MTAFLVTVGCLLFGSSSAVAHVYSSTVQTRDLTFPLPKLSTVPQLHTDMPLDCLIGYIAMDSAARTGSIPELLRMPPSLTIEHLRVPARYIFAMKDYNPVLLHRHFRSTMDSTFPNDRYRAYYANAVWPVIKTLWQRQEEFGRDYGLLVVSDYVLHVRVMETRPGMDSTFHRPIDWVNVACEVEEIFKGQYLPQNCRFATARDKRPNHIPLAPSECLVYGHRTQDQYVPQVGDEFFVFLDLRPIAEHLNILSPDQNFGAHRGRFRIVDGHVEDPENIFGLGTSPTVEDFKAAIRQRIDTIRTWTYN